MKLKFNLLLFVAVFTTFNLLAQMPTGFEKGSITLANGTVLSGYVKNNLQKSAQVQFMETENGKKKTFDGTAVNGVEINGEKYMSINGDFFKTICNGELCYIQKASDAAGKTVYNGSDATVLAGTAGKINDYFIYNSATGTLTAVSVKNINEVAVNNFGTCTAAIEKAKTINGDLLQLKDAVTIYNNRQK
jgi:hypothetical protein